MSIDGSIIRRVAEMKVLAVRGSCDAPGFEACVEAEMNEVRFLLTAYEAAKAKEQPERDRCLTPCYGRGETHLLSEECKGATKDQPVQKSERCIADDQWAIDAFYDGYDKANAAFNANGFTGLKPIIGGIRSLLDAADARPMRESVEVTVAKCFAYRDHNENGLETLFPYNNAEYAKAHWKDYLKAAQTALSQIEGQS